MRHSWITGALLALLAISMPSTEAYPMPLSPYSTYLNALALRNTPVTTKTVVESAIHKLSYALWKSKYSVFNAISVAFQTASVIAGPVVVGGVVNAAAKADMEKTVSKVLKKINDQSPGLFPAGLNFDQLGKKVVDEALPKDSSKNKDKGKNRPKASLDDFSPELQAMVGFSPEDEAAARELLTKAALDEAERSSEAAFQQTYFNPNLPTYAPPAVPTYPSEPAYAPPSSTYAPPQEPTYAPPQTTYSPAPQPTYAPPQTTYAPPQPTYAPPQPSYTTPPAFPPPYAIVSRETLLANDTKPEVKASNITEPLRVANTTVKASVGNATVNLNSTRELAANKTVQERQLETPAPDACRNRRRDMTIGNHAYQFSWLAGSPKLDWLNARNACRRQCMDLVSLETPAETEAIRSVLSNAWRQGVIEYSWTSGRLCDFPGCDRPDLQPVLSNGWFWSGSGPKLNAPGYPWGIGQPDQAQGPEACVAMLNPSIHQDPSGQFTLNDVGCHFQKPYICEDSDQLLSFIG